MLWTFRGAPIFGVSGPSLGIPGPGVHWACAFAEKAVRGNSAEDATPWIRCLRESREVIDEPLAHVILWHASFARRMCEVYTRNGCANEPIRFVFLEHS